MELRLKVALISLSYILWLIFLPTGCSDALNWVCTCTGVSSNNGSSVSNNNCSSSCQCIHGERSGAWNCTCGSQPTTNMNDLDCFSSCNCTSVTSGGSESSKEHSSNKGILITVILCAALTAIVAVLGSATCYLYRKDRLPSHTELNSRVHTFDKYTSWSSRSNLISHNSSSLSGSAVKTAFPFNPFKALVRQVSRMFGDVKEDLPGVIVRFSYGELDQATNKFSGENVIGVGGTSTVYRGQLSDGRMVAIKKLRPVGSEADFEFLSEIELISRLNHRHVVPLLGYCSENHGRQTERLLVFEYMSNGNLRDCLNKAQGKINKGEGEEGIGIGIMEWKTRVSIALGAARGLEYLHEAAAPRILHRDIKSTNILLDDMLRAKITDLGMAKRLANDENIASCSSSPARMLGTFGYFAPEYAIVGKASLKSDVFSFGVVLLELITSRPPVHKSPNKADESLVIWATSRLRDSKLVVTELPDPLLKGKFPEEEMRVMAHLARECLQWDPESRPTMSEVVQILSTIDPEKTNRRNLPSSFFMNTPHGNKRSITGTNTPRVDSLARREMLIQATSALTSERWSNQMQMQTQLQCPPSPPMSSCSLSEDQNDSEFEPRLATDLTSQFVERLIMLSSGSHSWRSPDDEVVDLTEPRLETFTQPSAFRPNFT
ncbi:Protein kinase [Rhynchospora pubera]|uniref:non-specific serine/threonine protein kinase n=1 Tax=Rhynchospora pubera TaxID=906938 RepID=A0AAV8FLP6_9POAL|nr:Protein kinase [Rhynchospora pubera]